MERINYVIDLLKVASGRKLKAAEIRLIDCMDHKEMSEFTDMLSDVLAARYMNVKQVNIHFEYGHFNDW